jgi:hypothetical protein
VLVKVHCAYNSLFDTHLQHTSPALWPNPSHRAQLWQSWLLFRPRDRRGRQEPQQLLLFHQQAQRQAQPRHPTLRMLVMALRHGRRLWMRCLPSRASSFQRTELESSRQSVALSVDTRTARQHSARKRAVREHPGTAGRCVATHQAGPLLAQGHANVNVHVYISQHVDQEPHTTIRIDSNACCMQRK